MFYKVRKNDFFIHNISFIKYFLKRELKKKECHIKSNILLAKIMINSRFYTKMFSNALNKMRIKVKETRSYEIPHSINAFIIALLKNSCYVISKPKFDKIITLFTSFA